MKYFKKIAGERIYLSPLNKDDLEIYTKWLNDPEVAEASGLYEKNKSLETERKMMETFMTEGHNYAIVTSGDTFIGGVGFNEIDNISRQADIGVFIGEAENRGKGYGLEALRLLLDYGFKTLNLHNVMLTVHSDNERAIACYKKAGFREFGRRRKAKFKNGRYMDVVYMDILSDDFKKG